MVLRFDPFRELDRLATVAFEGSDNVSVPMDVVRSANDVRVYFDLPGVDPASIDLTVERNRLTLKVSRRWELGEGERLVIRERPSGDFVRTLALSEGLDASKLSAHYEHGVLRLTIPVAEMAMARKVAVGSPATRAEVVEAHEQGDGTAHEASPAPTGAHGAFAN
jgi:HSP20 family protein